MHWPVHRSAMASRSSTAGLISRTVMRVCRPCDGRLDGNRDEVQSLGARARRIGPIAVVIASAGLGDAEPFGLGGTMVEQGVEALVAIGDGADGEPAITMVMVIGTGGSAGSRWARRYSERRGDVKRGRGQALADRAAGGVCAARRASGDGAQRRARGGRGCRRHREASACGAGTKCRAAMRETGTAQKGGAGPRRGKDRRR